MTQRKTKILIAEDEYIIAMDIKKVLEKLGYEVTSFVGKGIDAIKRTGTEKPDIVLMDIMLNDTLSGIDTAQIIKSKYNVPIVYLTALTDEETLQKAKLTEPGGYLLKPFDERGLHSAIEIALYKFRMESQLKQKTKELEIEKNRNDELLHHILPDQIIKELKLNGVVVPRHFESVTILFTDFLGFRQIINSLQPAELISDLNEIFSNFDIIVEKYGLEKLKTIGDTYMVCGGLSEKPMNHAVKVIYAAKEMLDYLCKKNKDSKVQWVLKAGINTGPIVAGIVGTNKFTYDVWGDTVNIASRMESSSGAGKINISGGTYELVKGFFNCEYRGRLAVKGKGEVDMYFIGESGRNSEELPE
jgi:class 3 adenylate cyclase/AmiR/NasT family two-component response regulator